MKKDLDIYNDKIASFSDVTNRLKEVVILRYKINLVDEHLSSR